MSIDEDTVLFANLAMVPLLVNVFKDSAYVTIGSLIYSTKYYKLTEFSYYSMLRNRLRGKSTIMVRVLKSVFNYGYFRVTIAVLVNTGSVI